jgi:glycerophosphoryl diester phosphodiesterase
VTAGRPRCAAHRGGARLWPENSLRAFRESIALGVDLIELDVHATADGPLAVIHDATLERTTEGRGPVVAMPAAAVRRLRVRGPDGALTEERVPLLEDVLALVAPSPVGLLVEVKGPARGARYEGLEACVVAALRDGGLAERATVMAFNPEVVTRVRALAPALPATLLVAARQVESAGGRAEAAVDWAVATGATDLGLEHTVADRAVVVRAHAASLRLGVWTLDDPGRVAELAAAGVDIITTDRPDVVLRALGRAA